jgi:hypothetical protein
MDDESFDDNILNAIIKPNGGGINLRTLLNHQLQLIENCIALNEKELLELNKTKDKKKEIVWSFVKTLSTSKMKMVQLQN